MTRKIVIESPNQNLTLLQSELHLKAKGTLCLIEFKILENVLSPYMTMMQEMLLSVCGS